jgi:basic amino acid/polyamine antiporter, APA family
VIAAAGLERSLVQVMLGLRPAAFGVDGVQTAHAVVFFAYSGFESAANMEEARNPKVDLPVD